MERKGMKMKERNAAEKETINGQKRERKRKRWSEEMTKERRKRKQNEGRRVK